jgi:glycosyltransferase involved in cell wall biosynthesis
MIHLITPEYPPKQGGVAHYTRQLADGLARAGEEVHVWCPAGSDAGRTDGVTVHSELGIFRRADLQRAGRLLDTCAGPRRLLVQWVPHGYGFRAMNIHFCWWLWQRAAAGDAVELMVHEPYLAYDRSALRQNIAATVQRLMTAILLRAAQRVWVAIPAWERSWKPYALGRKIPFTWLPVPSSLNIADRDDVAAVRSRVGRDAGPIVGHFGTHGILITSLLRRVLPIIASQRPDAHFLLIGTGGSEFRLSLEASYPALAGKISATGPLDHDGLAAHIAACDVLVQPYPDGVSSRRTTAMAGLRLGIAVTTTRGHLTEPFWEASGCVRLSDVGDPEHLAGQVVRLLDRSAERNFLIENARRFYDSRFDVRHTVQLVKALA